MTFICEGKIVLIYPGSLYKYWKALAVSKTLTVTILRSLANSYKSVSLPWSILTIDGSSKRSLRPEAAILSLRIKESKM